MNILSKSLGLCVLVLLVACGGKVVVPGDEATSGSTTGTGGGTTSSSNVTTTSSTTTTTGTGGSNEGGQDGGTGGNGGDGGSTSDSELVVLQPVDQVPGGKLKQNTAMIAMFKVNFVAKSDQSIDTIKFKRIGNGDPNNIVSVKVYNDQLPWVSCDFNLSISNVADCIGLNYKIPDGTTGYMVVYVTFGNALDGNQHAWEVEKASDIELGNAGKVTGSFPVQSNVFTINNQP